MRGRCDHEYDESEGSPEAHMIRVARTMIPIYPVTQGRTIVSRAVGDFLVTESRYEPYASIPRHVHALGSIVIPIAGSFRETLSDGDVECDTFDAMVKPADAAHADRYGRSGAHCLLIEAESLPIFGRTAHVRAGAVALIARRVQRELVPRDDVWQLALEGALLDLVATIARARTPEPSCVAVARDFIEAHWNARLSIAEIASAAGVHRATLVRAFRAHLQCSPASYIRRLRLEHAADALRRGDKSIGEIALECGFYDQSHFTNAFRRLRGVTPRAFARMRRLS